MSKEGQGPGQPPKTPCPGEKVHQDLQVLMQKVGGQPEVLLIGETLGGKDIHSLMGSFVKDLFSTTCHPISPTEVLKNQCNALCPSGGKPQQLVFFLCRASCVKGKQAELQKILKEVKQFVQKAPCALVGIIMEPQPGEAAEARGQLEKLMRGIFPKAPQNKGRQTVRKEDQGRELEEVQVEVEIYVPGQPKGKLAVMKAVCRASEALSKRGGSSWKSIALKSLLGITFVTGLASAGWYLYDQGMIPSNIIPTNFIPSNLFSFVSEPALWEGYVLAHSLILDVNMVNSVHKEKTKEF